MWLPNANDLDQMAYSDDRLRLLDTILIIIHFDGNTAEVTVGHRTRINDANPFDWEPEKPDMHHAF